MNFKSLLHKQFQYLSSPTNDELAYLALTTKIELPIRDRVAYGLHKHFHETKYISAREWRRSDLVILHDFKPACIVEFKAMYSFNAIKDAPRFRSYMDADIEKALEIADSDTEVFSILLATHPKQDIPTSYRGVVKYYSGVNRVYRDHNNSNAIKKRATETFNSYFKDENLYICDSIDLGNSFDIDVEILYWIYGPHTK